jgi:hypothetical protein
MSRNFSEDIKLINKITPGKWRVTSYSGGLSYNGPKTVYCGTDQEFGEPYKIPGRENHDNDVEFIAQAPDMVRYYMQSYQDHHDLKERVRTLISLLEHHEGTLGWAVSIHNSIQGIKKFVEKD